jgi:alpha-methylacyl-CoA racemase
MLLADMGATVVRVDRAPLGSDMEPFDGDVLGRGKRSIALDLKQDAARDVARRLAGDADVVLEGFRPGVMERLGLGPDELCRTNPRLVYARVTGWGQDGPMAERAGHDIDYIALAGVLGAIGREGQTPVPPINLLADFAGGGLACAFGVVCALLERVQSGVGQVIDAAMIDGAISLMAVFAVAIQSGRWGPAGTNIVDTGAHFYNTYETADGGYMAVGAMEPQFYARFLEGLGLDDEDLPAQMDERSWPAMKARVAAIFATKTRDEWTAVFDPLDACVVPVLSPLEALRHPHNLARGAFVPRDEGVVQPAPVPRLARTPGAVAGPPPAPGAHTREVLTEAGYPPERIAELAETGAIAWP